MRCELSVVSCELSVFVTSRHNFLQKKQYDMISTVSPRAESRGFNVKKVNGSCGL